MSEDNDMLTPDVSADGPDSRMEPDVAGAEPAAAASLMLPSPNSNGTRPHITFMGNSYDITSVVAVVTGGMIFFSCITCNMGYYCLPIVPVVLGLVGLLSADDSVDPRRTRLLSWLGIGGGGIVLLLMVIGILLYVGFIVLAIGLGAAAESR